MKKESRKRDHPGFSEHSKAACGYSAEMGAFLGMFDSLSCAYYTRVILILTKFGILISTWFQVVPFGV